MQRLLSERPSAISCEHAQFRCLHFLRNIELFADDRCESRNTFYFLSDRQRFITCVYLLNQSKCFITKIIHQRKFERSNSKLIFNYSELL